MPTPKTKPAPKKKSAAKKKPAAKKPAAKKKPAPTKKAALTQKPAPKKPAAQQSAPTKQPAAAQRAASSALAPQRVMAENVNHPGKAYAVDGDSYRAVRRAMLSALAGDVSFNQAELIQAVKAQLPPGPLRDKGGWWTKCVQLDLEAKRLIARSTQKPLRWHRV